MCEPPFCHCFQLPGCKQAEWGRQIRNYVFHPYKMVKDLRSGHETSNTGAVMDGALDPFMQVFKPDPTPRMHERCPGPLLKAVHARQLDVSAASVPSQAETWYIEGHLRRRPAAPAANAALCRLQPGKGRCLCLFRLPTGSSLRDLCAQAYLQHKAGGDGGTVAAA